jgi:pimeloyl-ACP methyl ester carboxylesterase
VVSDGGRPDLAGVALPRVQSPTLLIVGRYDQVVIRLNERAFAELRLAADWFHRHFHTHSPATDGTAFDAASSQTMREIFRNRTEAG